MPAPAHPGGLCSEERLSLQMAVKVNKEFIQLHTNQIVFFSLFFFFHEGTKTTT